MGVLQVRARMKLVSMTDAEIIDEVAQIDAPLADEFQRLRMTAEAAPETATTTAEMRRSTALAAISRVAQLSAALRRAATDLEITAAALRRHYETGVAEGDVVASAEAAAAEYRRLLG